MTPKLLILYKTAVVNNDIFKLSLSYCNKFENVTSYFIYCDNTIRQDIVIESQLIRMKIKEDNWQSILVKVIKSFEMFKGQDYTHIMVANISTIVNIPVIYKLISTHTPDVKCMSVRGEYTFKNIHYNFPSGAGYVFTMDLVNAICDFFNSNRFIVNNTLTRRFLIDFPTTDDIFFGYYLHMNRIPIEPIPRLDVITSDFCFNLNTDKDYSHYRIKIGNYNDNVRFFSFIIKSIYM